MKRLLIVNTSGMGVGGITAHMFNYLKELRQKQADLAVTLVVSGVRDEDLLGRFEKLGCELVFLPARRTQPLAYLLGLKKLIKQGRFDILHVHGNSSTMALELSLGKYHQIPIRIAHSHNTSGQPQGLKRLLIKSLHKSTTKAVACSKPAGDWLFGPGKFTVLPNGIDLGAYRFDANKRWQARQQLGLDDQTLLLGHVGNFNYQKNQLFLVKVIKSLKDQGVKARLVLIGQGEERAKVQQKVQALGLDKEVYFLGLRTDVAYWMQAMDIFVLPSRWEGFGMVLVEAQAAGLPTLASSWVPKDVAVSDHFSYLSLGLGWSTWAKRILELGQTKVRSKQDERLLRYEIGRCLPMLEEIYGLKES